MHESENEIANGRFDGLRVLAVVALVLDGAALAILALVPLARPLGLGNPEIPASAVVGWFLLAVPLVLAALASLGILVHSARLATDFVLKSAFCTCLLAGLLSLAMAASSKLPAGDARHMRGFAIVVFALYAINLLVLWRPALSDVGSGGAERIDRKQ